MRFSLLVLLLAVWSGSVEARPRHPYGRPGPHPGPAVRIVLNPWAPGWAPAPRAGWIWIAGAYAANGVWVPGYWAPAAERAGWVWVPGYWQDDVYVEGYWREAARPGMTWIEGRYEGTHFVPGYWAPVTSPPPAPPPPVEAGPVHHDYE